MSAWDSPDADILRDIRENVERETPFRFVPLGPRNDEDGRWCCGLHCGRPCPFGLKLKPGSVSVSGRPL